MDSEKSAHSFDMKNTYKLLFIGQFFLPIITNYINNFFSNYCHAK